MAFRGLFQQKSAFVETFFQQKAEKKAKKMT